MSIGKLVALAVAGSLFCLAGCATLEVTESKMFEPATRKQNVVLGLQAVGDRLQETLNDPGNRLLATASGQLFDRVVLLPKDSRFSPPQEIRKDTGVDYILTVGIGDIGVSGDLNPIWFASLPLLVFKVQAPIVTFQPNVVLDVTLRDAAKGTVLLQKQVMETSSDHFAPANPSAKVRKLISLTINNAMVTIFRDAQQSIATARKTGQ